jgi:hypothetical protein
MYDALNGLTPHTTTICKTTYPDGPNRQLHALTVLTLAKQLLVTTLTNTEDNSVT